MIGVSIDWKKICKKCGYKNIQTLLKESRAKGMTYQSISYDLGVSQSTLWNKALDLIEKGVLTYGDLVRRK